MVFFVRSLHIVGSFVRYNLKLELLTDNYVPDRAHGKNLKLVVIARRILCVFEGKAVEIQYAIFLLPEPAQEIWCCSKKVGSE